MTELPGTVSDLSISNTGATFKVGGREVLSRTPLSAEIHNGVKVVVLSNDTDDPFTAKSVTLIPVRTSFPWLWAGIFAVVVILAIALYLWSPSAKQGVTWTIAARDAGQAAAGVSIRVLDQNSTVLQSMSTNSQGLATFKLQHIGAFKALGPASATITGVFTVLGQSLQSALTVQSPYTLAVRTMRCTQPSPNIQVTLKDSSNRTRTALSGTAATAYFTNLPVSSYTVAAPNSSVVTVAINGVNRVLPVTLLAPANPFIPCLMFPPPHP